MTPMAEKPWEFLRKYGKNILDLPLIKRQKQRYRCAIFGIT